MADFGIYWKNFARERDEGDWPCTRWFTNSQRLSNQIQPGDRLWKMKEEMASALCSRAKQERPELFAILAPE